MLNILVVDDEYLVRLGIRETINWDEYGFQIIGEACDGEEGLEMALKHQPDIIITDIRMPFMDGLEFMTKLRENGLKSSIIVLSGHDEFAYARDAITNGAEAYLLKPLENEELINTVQKVAAKIKEDRSTHQYFEKLKGELSSIKKQFINDLVVGIISDENEIMEKIIFLDLPLDIANNYLIVIKVDDYNSIAGHFPTKYIGDLKETIVQSISRVLLLNSQYIGIVIERDMDEWVVILHVHEASDDNADVIKEQCNKLIELLKKEYPHPISIGISSLCRNIADISKSYREAGISANYKLIAGNSSVAYIGDNDIVGYRREIREAIVFIKNNYAGDINVDIAAKELYISPSHLMHLFRDELGKTFKECLTDCRIDMAKSLMRDSRYRIYEVCEKVGYKDVKYFSQIFKKVTGMSPSEYTKQKV